MAESEHSAIGSDEVIAAFHPAWRQFQLLDYLEEAVSPPKLCSSPHTTAEALAILPPDASSSQLAAIPITVPAGSARYRWDWRYAHPSDP